MVYGWPMAPDHDLYHHLQMGEILWRTRAWQFHDLFTYTALGREDDSWMFWLSQITFFQIHAKLGMAGLRGLNVALVWVTLFFLARYVWGRTRDAGLTTLATAATLVIHHRIQIIRPLLFGEALFSIIVFGFLARGTRLTKKEIALCAALAGLWANLHATAVILLPLLLMHALAQRQPAALFIPLATLVNPKGLGLYTAVWEANQAARLTGNWEFAPARPFVWLERLGLPTLLQIKLDPVSVALMVLVPLVIWRAWRRRDALLPYHLFCVGMPLLSVRHALYLFFPVAYFVSQWGVTRPSPRTTATAFLAAAGLLALYPVHRSGYVNLSIDRACDFIDETRLGGNFFSEDGWGAYLSYRHYPRVRVASDLRTGLHRDFFRTVGELKRDYGPAAWPKIVETLPAETDFVMTVAWKQQAQTFLDPARWIVVFENNHVTMAMKRNERNRENLSRILAYYRERGVPFDRARGFDSRLAWERAPAWSRDHQETMAWGRWPEPSVLKRWKDRESLFYESRQIPRPLG